MECMECAQACVTEEKHFSSCLCLTEHKWLHDNHLVTYFVHLSIRTECLRIPQPASQFHTKEHVSRLQCRVQIRFPEQKEKTTNCVIQYCRTQKTCEVVNTSYSKTCLAFHTNYLSMLSRIRTCIFNIQRAFTH
jgi:hypothetical protein